MAEQSRAVTDLLSALAAQAASHQVGAAVAAAQRKTAEARHEPGSTSTAGAQAAPVAAAPSQPRKQQEAAPQLASEAPQPQPQLVQRRAAGGKRSVLGNPARSASGAGEAGAVRPSPRSDMPRLKSTHAAGTAQQIAMATARQQLALQAQRAQEEAEAETPAFLAVLYMIGWAVVAVLAWSRCWWAAWRRWSRQGG